MTVDNNGTPPFDIIIVGGGLSGLLVARNLNYNNNNSNEDGERKIIWKLFEATSQLGGRLQNDLTGHNRNIDLGGAWIWPPHQPQIMSALVNSPTLGIKTFLQPGEDYDSSTTTRIVGGAVEFANKIYNEVLMTNENDNDKNMVLVQTDGNV